MKMTKTGSGKMKKKVLFVVIALLAITLALAVLEKLHVIDLIKPSDSVVGPSQEEQAKQKQFDNERKQDFVENDKLGQPATEPAALELSAKQEADGTVTVFTKIRNIAEGTCDLAITNLSASYIASAPLIYQSEFSSCAGFSVPVSKLGPGTWSIKLSTKSASTVEKTINFEVH